MVTSRINAGVLAGLIALGSSVQARAEGPLSAIDWLSRSVATPAQPVVAPAAPEPGIAQSGSALPHDVVVTTLDSPSPDAAGVLPSSATGLPRNLWGLGKTIEIAAQLSSERAEALPALQEFLLTLLQAEANPPADSSGRGQLLLARIDKLLELGALDQAQALIAAAGKPTPQIFRRAFDVAMLTGTEDYACADLQATPGLAPTYPARIFCLARSGDWNAAALTLRVAQALGYVNQQEDELLSRFLDPDLYEGEPHLVPPQPVTPLTWRILEAIGEGLPTAQLPLAFSHAELRDTAGWKAQIDAAERLARAGAITPNVLLGVYSERLPAASGGVWDRVEAFQKFEAALAKGDPAAVARTLPAAWDQMARAELEIPFAALFARRLMTVPLQGEAGALAFRVALLSPAYEQAAVARKPESDAERFLIGLARGNLQVVPQTDSLARAIAKAFLQPEPPPEALALLEQDRLGEALLAAIDLITQGVQGELRGVTQGLSVFRHVGLEDVARRTALQLMLLERRG